MLLVLFLILSFLFLSFSVFDLLLRLFSEPQLVARKPAELTDWFRRTAASRFVPEIVRKLTAKGNRTFFFEK